MCLNNLKFFKISSEWKHSNTVYTFWLLFSSLLEPSSQKSSTRFSLQIRHSLSLSLSLSPPSPHQNDLHFPNPFLNASLSLSLKMDGLSEDLSNSTQRSDLDNDQRVYFVPYRSHLCLIRFTLSPFQFSAFFTTINESKPKISMGSFWFLNMVCLVAPKTQGK